jgi:hypothetical protein
MFLHGWAWGTALAISAQGVVGFRAVTCEVALLLLGPGAHPPTPASNLTSFG